eukprot:NODE_47_length_27404_cov_0.284270.p11 type:complete len:135 gc:universal NODE_47_length_27404_cov_0.284270:23938-23534(-)
MEEEQHQIRNLLISGEIRRAGYYLNKYPNRQLQLIWKAILEHQYPDLHLYLENEDPTFQLNIMKFVANMLCDISVSLSIKECQFFLGPYLHQIADLYNWDLEDGFYILKPLKKPVLTIDELKEISETLIKAKEQ